MSRKILGRKEPKGNTVINFPRIKSSTRTLLNFFLKDVIHLKGHVTAYSSETSAEKNTL